MERLEEAQIVEQFHTVLDGFGADVIGIYIGLEQKLKQIAAPNVSWHEATGDTGLLSGLLGKRKDIFVIQHARLREYFVVVAAQAVGTALQVSWFLMASPRVANALQRAVRRTYEDEKRFDIGGELDLFDRIDLNGFLGVARLALKHAVQRVTKDSADDGFGMGQ